ncbi:hypothetical protein C8Q80DRAFT_1152126 [Daedaleopsis nitida]|nr:hypothetical protein C8Q80DRAFT_1152126 [Daedaleopsis nitida]
MALATHVLGIAPKRAYDDKEKGDPAKKARLDRDDSQISSQTRDILQRILRFNKTDPPLCLSLLCMHIHNDCNRSWITPSLPEAEELLRKHPELADLIKNEALETLLAAEYLRIGDNDGDAVTASSEGKSTSEQRNAAELLKDDMCILYQAAWGKKWPRKTRILLKSEISDVNDEDVDSILDEFPYTCFEDMALLKKSIKPASIFPPVLVSLKEYKLLMNILAKKGENGRSFGAVVVGQSGIGKTTFLLYLLLDRLEQKLPTAIQFRPDHYVIFNGQGVTVNKATYTDPQLDQCWALADSNSVVTQPCLGFLCQARCIIQATSPNKTRWKSWSTQNWKVRQYIMDLPSAMEIAAIAKETAFAPSRAYFYVGKWGPSIRTVLALCESSDDDDEGTPPNESTNLVDDPTAPSDESTDLVDDADPPSDESTDLVGDADPSSDESTDATVSSDESTDLVDDASVSSEEDEGAATSLVDEAKQAAVKVCAAPALISAAQQMEPASLNGAHSILLFVRPLRGNNGELNRRRAQVFIPTDYLNGIVEENTIKLTNHERLKLFEAFSSHSYTRPAAGWIHECAMHRHLCTGSNTIELFRGNKSKTVQTTTRLLFGVLSSLKTVTALDDFYWAPNQTNFPGVDAPKEGLKVLWEKFLGPIRKARKWHVVFICDSTDTARVLVKKYNKLKGMELGSGGKLCGVWGCVIAQS